MELDSVMDEIAAQLDLIDGLNVHAHPVGSVTPPAAVLTYPDDFKYDESYGGGTDRMTLPVVLVVGKASDRGARDKLASYVNRTGPASIKAALESGAYQAFDEVHVPSVEFDVVRIAQTDYLAATFELDIIGEGSA